MTRYCGTVWAQIMSVNAPIRLRRIMEVRGAFEIHVADVKRKDRQDHEHRDNQRRDPEAAVLPELAADQGAHDFRRDCWTVVVVGGRLPRMAASDGRHQPPPASHAAPAFSRRTDRPPKGYEAHPKEPTPAVAALEEHRHAPEHFAFVERFELSRSRCILRRDSELHETLGHRVHGRVQYDVTAIDEDHVRQQVLDLFNLVGCENDGAFLVEIVVQQRVVELAAEQKIETQRGFVEHEQPRINRQNQCEMQLGDHALGELAYAARHFDVCLAQEVCCPGPVKAGMHSRDEVECLADTQPTRQHGNVRNEADILHELITLGARVASEDTQFAFELGEAEDGLE